MSYIALYRKYRPRKFVEVVSQEHVKTTLLNALSQGKVAHAYLFCGPRGIGKTTVGRLLAHAVNCEKVQQNKGEPCGQCEPCKQIAAGKTIDLIEIDAASNRGIDEIRELREKVRYTPTNLKHLVFIIDEVHMLTLEAFNALLKTLEEPPAHAIFVLATTDPQKVPPTILSRCQRFDFKRLSRKELTEHLTNVAQKEKIKIDPEASKIIAGQADGSSRDALSILGQAAVTYESRKITENDLRTLLGLTGTENIDDFLVTIFRGDLQSSLQQINTFINGGYAPHQLIEDILTGLRKMLLVKSVAELPESFEIDLSREEEADWRARLQDVNSRAIIRLINLVIEAKNNQKYSQIPQLPLEMAVISFLGLDSKTARKSEGNEDKDAEDTKGKKKSVDVSSQKQQTKKLKNRQKEAQRTPAGNNKSVDFTTLRRKWPAVLSKIQAENYSLGSLLKSSELSRIEGNKLILICRHEFHKEFMQKSENRNIIEQFLGQVCEAKMGVRCIVGGTEDDGQRRNSATAGSSLVKNALEILGGEVTN